MWLPHVFVTRGRRYVYQLSVPKDGQEEARDVLLLPLEYDGAVLSCLCLFLHQVEELFKTHQVVIECLGLKIGCYSSSTVWSSTIHTVIKLVIICGPLQQLVLLLGSIVLLICNDLAWVWVYWLTSLYDIFIGKEGNGTQFSSRYCLRWVRCLIITSTENRITGCLFVVRAQIQEALTDADHFLQGAIAVDIIRIVEIWVELGKLSQDFFLTVIFLLSTVTLSHYYLLIFSYS